MGFDTEDLLRQAGFNEGDIVPVSTLTPPAATNSSTTSTSFTGAAGIGRNRLNFGNYAPDSDTLKLKLTADTRPGSGETYAVRFVTEPGGTELASVTGITSDGVVESSFTDFPGITFDKPTGVTFQHRTNPGTNSSETFAPSLLLGVEL